MSHEHSPLPWIADGSDIRDMDEGQPDNLVAETRGGKERFTNAEFIVHACNSHDDLFRQATKAAKQAEKMRSALGNIIERAEEIRDENSGDKCAMDASDIETMARDALKGSGK